MANVSEVMDVLAGRAAPPTSQRMVLKHSEVDVAALAKLGYSSYSGCLRLEGCSLGDADARALADSLASNTSLTGLELPGNLIGAAGAQALLQAVRSSTGRLTALDLCGNPCEQAAPAILQSIELALQRNRCSAWVVPEAQGSPGPASGRPSVAPGTPSSPSHCRALAAQPGGSGGRGKENRLALSGGKGLGQQALGPVGSGAVEVEYRLQNLEATQSHLHGELDTIKGLGNTIEAWRQEMDAASAQAATVLTLVTADTGQVRDRLDDLDEWRQDVESASGQVQQTLQGLHSNWARLESQIDELQRQAQNSQRSVGSSSCWDEEARPGTGRGGGFGMSAEDLAAFKATCQQQLQDLQAEVARVQAAHASLEANAAQSGGGVTLADVEVLEDQQLAIVDEVHRIDGTMQKLDRQIEGMLRTMLGQLSGGQQRAQQDLARVSSGHKSLVDRVARAERSLSALSHQLAVHTKSCGEQLTKLSGEGGQLAADRRHDAATASQLRAAVQRSVKTAAAAERSHQGLQERLQELAAGVEKLRAAAQEGVVLREAQSKELGDLRSRVAQVEAAAQQQEQAPRRRRPSSLRDMVAAAAAEPITGDLPAHWQASVQQLQDCSLDTRSSSLRSSSESVMNMATVEVLEPQQSTSPDRRSQARGLQQLLQEPEGNSMPGFQTPARPLSVGGRLGLVAHPLSSPCVATLGSGTPLRTAADSSGGQHRRRRPSVVSSGGGVSGVVGAAGAQARSPQPLTVDPLQRVICNELDSQKARCDTLEQTVRAQEVTIKRLEAALADLLAAQQSPSGHSLTAGNTPTWAPPKSAARSQEPAGRQVPVSPAPVVAAKGAAGKPLGFGSSASTVGSSAGRKLKAAAVQMADTEGLTVSRSSQSANSMSRLGSAIPAKPRSVEQPRDSLDSRRDDVKLGKSRLSRLFKTGS